MTGRRLALLALAFFTTLLSAPRRSFAFVPAHASVTAAHLDPSVPLGPTVATLSLCAPLPHTWLAPVARIPASPRLCHALYLRHRSLRL
jgi:hypothetical protein